MKRVRIAGMALTGVSRRSLLHFLRHFLRRIVDAGEDARCRSLQRDIERVISGPDRRLSDEIERRILRRLMGDSDF